jgi:hypothetical protein
MLKAEADRLDRAALDSALAHRSAFPAAATALAGAAAALADADAAAVRLRRGLPSLADAADSFARAAPALAARGRGDAALRCAAPALATLFSAPALAATAARAGAFEEALDVRAFAGRLALTQPGSKAAAALDAAAGRAAANARAALLDRLAGPATLADCLRCVGYLRRLTRGVDAGEAGLRADFLGARARWLAVAAAAAAADGDGLPAADAVKRATDAHRLHLFDVVMQFRAVFGGGGEGGGGDADGDLAALVAARTAAYLAALASALPSLSDGPSLAAALEHASYAGASLGRAGADARPALAPLFEGAAARLFAGGLDAALAAFESGLESHSWVAVPAGGGGGGAAPTAAGGPPPPPPAALAHAPVARLVNGLAAALNDLRACAPPAAGPAAAAALEAALRRAAVAVAAARDARAGTPAAAAAADAANTVRTAVLPHAAACFACVYPDDAAAVDARGAAALAEAGDE